MSCVLNNNNNKNSFIIKEGILMMKKLVIFGLIGIFLLSGCEQIKELYGIQPSGEEEYVPLEEIKVEEEIIEAPPVVLVNETPKLPTVTTKNETAKVQVPKVKEEKPKGEAKVIIVEENGIVSLKPKATDPDADKLTFTYSTPIDKDGKWQTKYGDAGEYTITITASDGQLSTTKDVLIIVNKKEEAPTIDEAMPKEDALQAKENSKIEFSVKASDLNKDLLAYSWKLDGADASKSEKYTYSMGYDAQGQHTIKVVVSDKTKEVSKLWAVKVENVNRKPVLEQIRDIKMKETETVVITPKATDPDNDKLTFSVNNDKFKKADNRFEWKTTYDDSGEYNIIITVSDGTDTVSQPLKVTIENVNRPPVIEDIVLG